MGYTNTEAFLLSIADVTAVSLGSYETTRIFDIRSFEAGKRSATSPNARIYTSRLLHWIDQNYVDNLLIIPMEDRAIYFDQTPYQGRNVPAHFSVALSEAGTV